MENNIFNRESDSALKYIYETIESQDNDYNIEIEFNGEILELKTEQGLFIINKHSSAKEIWLASPISGPHHFKFKNEKWLNRDDKEIYNILENDLNLIPNIKIIF